MNEEVRDTWINTLLKAILTMYDNSDIFNSDETGLLFKFLLDKNLSFKVIDVMEGREVRLTYHLLKSKHVRMEKLQSLMIGKS